jgi:hypothetical protein
MDDQEVNQFMRTYGGGGKPIGAEDENFGTPQGAPSTRSFGRKTCRLGPLRARTCAPEGLALPPL